MTSARDVVVVGAGPAGCATAILLAEAGHDVLVLEREQFPRDHIGESLLPLGTGVLSRLGLELPETVFRFKRGAQFICEATDRQLDVSFEEAFPGPPRHAWQVNRAEFDMLLRDRARAVGAEVRHGVHVRGVEIQPDHVEVQTTDEVFMGRHLIDATGQGRLMARHAKAVEPFSEFGVAAAYQHFEGVGEEAVGDHGDIRIMLHHQGWGWAIPLPGDRLSVGLVTRDKGAKPSLVESFVAGSPLLSGWTQGCARTEPRLIGNYSYRNQASYGRRYGCVGDAACFLDPVFSSGVSLALAGAARTADVLGPALEAGRESDPNLLAPVGAEMQAAYTAFASLIGRFYHTRIVDNLFFGAEEGADFRRG
ncbi:MAG: NAD(P)/FAD-dependent oxidoreductase, partial [Myxococcota bacterium]